MDFFARGQIDSSIQTIDKILSSGIFSSENIGHALFKSAFIEILIELRNLMYHSNKIGCRIDFIDDVNQQGRVKDVSDLIKYVRDAVCHPDSENHYVAEGITSTFNVAYGRVVLFQIGDHKQESVYNDDICFFFGSQQIYLKRHIIRAFNEAKHNLSKIYK